MSEITQAASIQTATCETMFSRTIVRDQRQSTIWWSQTGSNRRPHACKARALPAELWPRNQKTNALHSIEVVGLGSLELPTSRLSSARSNQLSYKPLTRGACCDARPAGINAGSNRTSANPWRVLVRDGG